MEYALTTIDMEAQPGAPQPPTLAKDLDQSPDMSHLHTAQTGASDVSSQPTKSASSTPLTPTPKTPNLSTPTAERTSHAATSPFNPTPHPPSSAVRRSSSSTTLNNQRTSSSPNLMKKSSRSSLGGQQAEEQDKRPTPKRSISNLITGLRDAQKTMESIEEPVPLTAPQIAMEHFARELMAHAQPDTSAETVVILHDACYGHRYSRPKTTKSILSMIVERPERIHASVLGASAAYVRLGAHHEGGRFAPHPNRRLAGPPPFKIRRTARSMDITSSFVTNVHGTAWMGELKGMCDKAGERLAAGAKELSRSATPTEPEKKKLHEGDLYLAPESLNAFQGALGGVADAVDTVFSSNSQAKRAFVAVRPPGHHCSADHPSGFCWLNNVHVGIEYAAQTHGLTHAAILDFDLHHGDGSQAITWERNSKNNVKRLAAKPTSRLKLGPDIGYYSLHDINSYPCEMGDDEKVQAAGLCIENAHGQSIWNVHLEEWKTEEEFWRLYETRYVVLLEKARKFLRHHTTRLRREGKIQPCAAIFISAGFDASEWEGAGMQRHKVNVPTEFYARFTRDMVKLAQEESSACEGRVVSVLEGGYSDRALCSGVLSHLSGLCGSPVGDGEEQGVNGAGDLDQMMRGLGISEATPTTSLQYDREWWSAANLHALEMKVNPPPPPQAKKVRTGPQPTYATPTESFAYKVVDANKFARSISGTMREVPRPQRPPTPPPPEVDWVIATQELSKLLIPTDRQTRSCTPEELGGVRVKKEPQVLLPTTEEAGKPRQLRDRKSKAPAYAASAHSDELESLRSVSRNSRRQTIADFAPSAEAAEPAQQRRASRRLSAGSTLSSATTELDPAAPPVPALPRSRPPTSNGAMKPPIGAQGVQVKKTRAPAKPKQVTGSSKPSSPAHPTAQASLPTTNGVPTQPAPPSAIANNSSASGIDDLTTGMKKVTLKVGTREEHDRKQKEKVDAERRARALKGAETRRVNAAARKARAEQEKERETGAGVPAPMVPNSEAETAPKQQDRPSAQPMQSGDPAMLAQSLPVATAQTPAAVPEVPVAPEEQAADLLTMPNYANAGYPAQTRDSFALDTGSVEPVAAPPSAPSPIPPSQAVRPKSSQPPAHPPRESALSYQQPFSSPAAAAAQSYQAPQSIPVPDSAARQLIQENHFANGGGGAALSPIPQTSSPSRPGSGVERQKLPVWSETGVIPFAAGGGGHKQTDGIGEG